MPSVTASRLSPVSVSTIDTVTLGRTAPEESTTVPVSTAEEPTPCPKTRLDVTNMHANRTNTGFIGVSFDSRVGPLLHFDLFVFEDWCCRPQCPGVFAALCFGVGRCGFQLDSGCAFRGTSNCSVLFPSNTRINRILAIPSGSHPQG